MVLFEIKGHSFSELCVSFQVCIFLFVNKTKFVQFSRVYAHISKSYKHFITGKLIYSWKQDG